MDTANPVESKLVFEDWKHAQPLHSVLTVKHLTKSRKKDYTARGLCSLNET